MGWYMEVIWMFNEGLSRGMQKLWERHGRDRTLPIPEIELSGFSESRNSQADGCNAHAR
jgi:hypothetical protein